MTLGSRVARTAGLIAGAPDAQAAGMIRRESVTIELCGPIRTNLLTLLTAVHLAALVWERVDVVVSDAEVALRCRELGLSVRARPDAVRIVGPETCGGLRLRIDGPPLSDPRAVSVSSSGWNARVAAMGSTEASAPSPLPASSDPHPLGQLVAAALGVGELFLRALGARPPVEYELSLYARAKGVPGSLPTGPAERVDLNLDGILIGCGTVGAGFAWAIRTLATRGRIDLVDHDVAVDDNFGAHPLMRRTDRGLTKVEIVARTLRDLPELDVRAYPERLRLYRYRLTGPHPPQRLVVSGLDGPEARQQAQRLWAPLHVDMATKDGLQLQVITRRHPGQGLCLLRRFAVPAEAELAEISRRTGLDHRALEDPLAAVSDEDVWRAPTAELRARLGEARRRGQRRCNVITRADRAAALDSDDDFVGSAPFTALFAGILAAAEVLLEKTLAQNRDSSLVLWHFQSLNYLATATTCIDDCECRELEHASRPRDGAAK